MSENVWFSGISSEYRNRTMCESGLNHFPPIARIKFQLKGKPLRLTPNEILVRRKHDHGKKL